MFRMWAIRHRRVPISCALLSALFQSTWQHNRAFNNNLDAGIQGEYLWGLGRSTEKGYRDLVRRDTELFHRRKAELL